MKKLAHIIMISFLYGNLNSAIKNVPSAYSSIQLALNACSAGDTVLVQPGIYIVSLNWPSIANIKLLSAGDSTNTILDANKSGFVIQIDNGNGLPNNFSTTVKGFKIINGYNTITTGGGIRINKSKVKIRDCFITNNQSISGGGVSCTFSEAVFENCRVNNNLVKNYNTIYGVGFYGLLSIIDIKNCEISFNKTADSIKTGQVGGGLCLYNCTLTATDLNISNNLLSAGGETYLGGGIYLAGCRSTTLTNLTVQSNTLSYGGKSYAGGGIHLFMSNLRLVNALIASNVLDTGGTTYYGGGIADFSDSKIDIMNSTISENKGSLSQTIMGSGLFVSSDSSLTIQNSILYNQNQGNEIYSNASINLLVSYSNIRGYSGGTGNINFNPTFVSTNDFHLSSTSPCINTANPIGAPSFDLQNNPRPIGGAYDMGCYEYSPPAGLRNLLNFKFEAKIFPDPVEEVFTIKYSAKEKGPLTLAILDAYGVEIKTLKLNNEIGINEIQVSTEELKTGVYFCRLSSYSVSGTLKFIKK